MIVCMKNFVGDTKSLISWRTVGFLIGALLGIAVLLAVRMPLYFSVPFQIVLLVAGGKIGERFGSR